MYICQDVIAKRESAVRPKIDPTVFAVVSVILLCAFMGVVPGTGCRTGLDLYRARHAVAIPRALRKDAITISVNRDGRVFLELDQLPVEALSDQIRESVRKGAEKRIYLNVDQRAKYGTIADVIDQTHVSGVQNVTILTR